MKLISLIIEGMYDKLVGEINKDIFKTIKSAMLKSGTQESPKKYKGYTIRKNPETNTSLQDLFQNETRTIYVGEFNDSISGVGVEVELKLAITEEGVTPGKFYIDGSAEADSEYPSIEVHVGIHPSDGETIFSKIQPVLRDLVRHEVEHLTHGRKSASAKASKVLRGDEKMRVRIRQNPELYYKYFLLPKEVDANIHGLYSKAKTMKRPYQVVVNDYLNSLVDDGIITLSNKGLIYKTWKARIEKIGGIPNLK